jgi:hypothetical protein
MTPEAQRIAIAEACGWKPNPFEMDMCGQVFPQSPPDYLNDLNAVHDFVSQKFKSKFMLAEYEYMLRACLADGRPTFEVAGYELANATAAQKAEASLKALNLWKNA